MELSPEERDRIFQEEKARHEAQEKLKAEEKKKASDRAAKGCLGFVGLIGLIVLVCVIGNLVHSALKTCADIEAEADRVVQNADNHVQEHTRSMTNAWDSLDTQKALDYGVRTHYQRQDEIASLNKLADELATCKCSSEGERRRIHQKLNAQRGAASRDMQGK